MWRAQDWARTFSEYPLKDIDIKLVGCYKWSLKIDENIFFIQFLCTKTVAERNSSQSDSSMV